MNDLKFDSKINWIMKTFFKTGGDIHLPLKLNQI